MRPNPKPSATALLSSPSLPVGGDDDDDDFQSPPPARLRRPLKSSSGAVSRRPRKKLKPSYSFGKENHPVAGGTVFEDKATAAAGAETLEIGSKVRGVVPEGKDETDGEICVFLRSRAEPSDDSKLGVNGHEVCVCGSCMGSSRPNLTESRLLESDVKRDLGSEGSKEPRDVGSRACSAVLEERCVVVEEGMCDLSSKEEWSEFGVCMGRYHSNLIELRPLELHTDSNFGVVACEEAQEFGSVSEEGKVGRDAGVASQFEVKDSERSGFGVSKGNYHWTSIESKLLQLNAQYNFGGGDCNEVQKLGSEACILVSEGRNVAADGYLISEFETRENKSSVSEACKRGHSNSIGSKLLQSSMNHSCEGDNCDDFEIGTQFNELLNLCMEEDVEGHSDNRASPMQGNKMDSGMFKSDCQVECPLCGSDISDLSEEMRQMHTNNCLDKDEPAKETNSHQERESCAGGGTLGNRSVVEWLRNLGLSRYEEVFVREEVDWETLQWFTEEDLLSIGITSLGPRKKIIHALGELRKKADHANDVEANVLNSSNTTKARLPMTGNKLITEYFWCPSVNHEKRVCKASKPSKLNSQKNSRVKMATSRSHAVKGKVKDTPLWCCIPGTPFRVDAFRYLRGDCCHWFLTHFHLDHYQGLTRSFCHGKIYCSSITAHLVNHKIGVPWERLHVLPLNQKITIAGVNLTCFDANHCPGSLIILFEPPNGKAVLHTGDFRFSSEMANNPVLQSCHIHTLILDTTYCNPRYDFPDQETVIQFVIEAIQAEAFNPKTLFLIGSYTIGKERLFMEVARLLQKKIYVGAAKLQILKFLELPEEIMHWFTANETESHIHVVPMWTLASVKRMKYISSQYSNRFDLIVAFCPTGWSFGKGRKRTPGRRWQQGTVIRYEVPYSEHSSFTELREFVRFISPEHIIPSVNNNGPESADTMLAQLLSDS